MYKGQSGEGPTNLGVVVVVAVVERGRPHPIGTVSQQDHDHQ